MGLRRQGIVSVTLVALALSLIANSVQAQSHCPYSHPLNAPCNYDHLAHPPTHFKLDCSNRQIKWDVVMWRFDCPGTYPHDDNYPDEQNCSQDKYSRSNWENAIKGAVGLWNDVDTSYNIFKEVGAGTNKIKAEDPRDFEDILEEQNMEVPDGFEVPTFARILGRPDSGDGCTYQRLDRATIYINMHYDWDFGASCNGIDAQAMLTHEFAHWLGFSHSSSGESVTNHYACLVGRVGADDYGAYLCEYSAIVTNLLSCP